jgi:F0F1-type ATP synthase epsilon subunit
MAEDKKEEKPAGSNVEAVQADSHTSKTVTNVDIKPKKGLLRAKIYTPFEMFYEGDAKSVSAVNETGPFDILPGHHNFITMLKACDVIVKLPDEKKEPKLIPIARGLMHVKEDSLIIFLDI